MREGKKVEGKEREMRKSKPPECTPIGATCRPCEAKILKIGL